MRRYVIKSLGSLIHLLFAQGILALDSAITHDNQLAHLNVNLEPLRETPTPSRILATFNLNEYPPSESTIASLSSTSRTVSSEHTLSLRREDPEENQLLSTAESIPHQLYSPSSLKRKEAAKSYVEPMRRNIRQKVSEQHGHVAHNNGVGFPDHFTALHSELQATPKKPAGLLKYTPPSRGQNVGGLALVHQEEVPLTVDNWNYVKLDLKMETIPDHIHPEYGEPVITQEQFFTSMHRIHSYLPRDKTFWIPKHLIGAFQHKYRQVRTSYPYQEKFSLDLRLLITRDILLKIAEDKLHIDSCWSSSGGIKTHLKQSIDLDPRRARFIRKLTKLSVSISVLYMTLFGEHEGPTLSQSHVSSMVAFIQHEITHFSKKPVPAESPGSEEGGKWHKVLHDFKHKSNCNAAAEMNLAWNMFEYWLKMTRESSYTSLTFVITEVHELINKIIFYSNHKYFMRKSLEKEMKKGTLALTAT